MALERISSSIPGLVVAAVLFVGLIVGVRQFFEIMYIPQNGLYPNLPADSKVLLDLRAYTVPEDVSRGELIVFRTKYQGRDIDFVWRVVGLPGEAVSVEDGRVVIGQQAAEWEPVREDGDCQIWQESYADAAYQIAECPDKDSAPSVDVVLAEDEFFVLGDNRYHSVDSRYLGPIPFEKIRGRAEGFGNFQDSQ